jgi:hypothetical protein
MADRARFSYSRDIIPNRVEDSVMNLLFADA